MDRKDFRPFMYGAFCMLILAMFATRASYNQFQEIKALKTQCEATLPRNEHCVVVVIPQSKD